MAFSPALAFVFPLGAFPAFLSSLANSALRRYDRGLLDSVSGLCSGFDNKLIGFVVFVFSLAEDLDDDDDSNEGDNVNEDDSDEPDAEDLDDDDNDEGDNVTEDDFDEPDAV